MIADAPLVRSGDEIRRAQIRDPAIVEGLLGGCCVVALCDGCGKPRRPIPRRLADGTLWYCAHCGRRAP